MTIDETWIYHYTQESKQLAKQWVGPGRTTLKPADNFIVISFKERFTLCDVEFYYTISVSVGNGETIQIEEL